MAVVAPVTHDQQVPSQVISLQPRHGLGLNPQGASGEQDDLETRIEQLEQPGDLLDDGVVTTGLEEGCPVPLADLEEVLATHGVGQHAIDVEHHGTGWFDLVDSVEPVPEQLWCSHRP